MDFNTAIAIALSVGAASGGASATFIKLFGGKVKKQCERRFCEMEEEIEKLKEKTGKYDVEFGEIKTQLGYIQRAVGDSFELLKSLALKASTN